jgi:plasmid replication initiation protein
MSLLPDRHRNRDFFILDIIEAVPRDDMASMEHPLFALAAVPGKAIREYRRGDTLIRYIPSGMGLPTIHDKDILIFCVSQLIERKNRGEPIGPVVRFTAHDLLVATNRDTSKRGYDLFKNALNRLRGTTIETTVPTGNTIETEGFGLIDSYRVLRTAPITGRMIGIEITLSRWLMRAIEANEVLTLARDYFRLRSALDRRLYEIARKHCGQQASWKIGLGPLHEKTAFASHARKLRAHLRELAMADYLPDYRITIEADDMVTFHRRSETQKTILATASITVDTLDTLVDNRALDLARAEARWRGRDFYALKAQFVAFVAEKGRPKNLSGAFVGFVRKQSRLG